MKFITNNYPIKFAISGIPGKESEDIPPGSIFTIDGINCGGFDLKPVKNIEGFVNVSVTPEMLKVGFTETEYLD